MKFIRLYTGADGQFCVGWGSPIRLAVPQGVC